MKKPTKKNEFENYAVYDIEDLDAFRLIEGTNMVLVEVFKSDVEKTIGGLITEGMDHFNFAEHTERRGRVVKTVEKFVPGRTGREVTMWQTDIDIEIGDEVYFNYFDKINSYLYRYQERNFVLMPYTAIILARRGKRTIMCNGYVLLEKLPPDEKKGLIYIPRPLRDREWKILYHGEPNERHFLVVQPNDLQKYLLRNPDKKVYAQGDGYMLVNNPNRSDSPDLKRGDKVFITDKRWMFDLEVYAYARFDNRKIHTVCPRHCIQATILD